MKWKIAVTVLLVLTGCGSSQQDTPAAEPTEESAESTALNNTVCPVMQLAVSGDQWFEWEGYRISICCPGCENSFRAQPEMYIPVLLDDPGVDQGLKAELSEYLTEEP